MSAPMVNNPYANEVQRTRSLAALSKAQLSEEKTGAGRMFSILLLCVFFVALLAALVTGVMVYTHATESQNATNTQREGVQLVSNVVRANDSTGAVAVGNGPEGKALVIVEQLSTGTYETRLYLYEGNIVQEYSLSSSPYDPARASVVTASSTFEFSYSKGLLTVTTDQGTAEVALRYLQGDE